MALTDKKLQKYAKDLAGGDVSQKYAAAAALAEGDERAIYPLIKALSDESPAVQEAAMQALIKIGGEVAAYMTLPVLRKGAAQRNAALVVLKELGAKSVPLLYDLLRDLDDDMRKFALDLLGDIKEGVQMDKIAPMLNDKNPNVRASAARALGCLGDKNAVSYIESALKDEEWVAFSALEALGAIGGEDVVYPISRLLQSASDTLKFSALETLGMIDCRKSKNVLVTYIKETSDFTRAIAVKSLLKLGIEPSMNYFSFEIQELLDADDWADKLLAVGGIKALKDKSSILKLVDLAGSLDMAHPDSQERYDAVVDAIRAVADCKELIDILGGVRPPASSMKFRGKAILVELLGKLNCREAVGELMNLLRNSIASVRDIRRGAALALVEIADASTVETLIDALEDEDCHVKKHVVYALRKIASPRAFEPIANLLNGEKCEDVVEEAVRALLAIDTKKFVAIADGMDENIRVHAARYCMDPALVLKFSYDKLASVRTTAVIRLAEFDAPQAAARIDEVMKEPDAEMRKVAVIGLTRAVRFSEVLLSALNDKEMWVRFYAVKALSAIISSGGGASYTEELLNALQDEDVPVVLAAMDALKDVGGEEVFNAISQLSTGHADPNVREKAGEVLKSL
jgi:HEAT repeat protein